MIFIDRLKTIHSLLISLESDYQLSEHSKSVQKSINLLSELIASIATNPILEEHGLFLMNNAQKQLFRKLISTPGLLFRMTQRFFQFDEITGDIQSLDEQVFELQNIYHHVYNVDQPTILLKPKKPGLLENPNPIQMEARYIHAMKCLFRYKEMKILIEMPKEERLAAQQQHQASLKSSAGYNTFIELVQALKSKDHAQAQYELDYEIAKKDLLMLAQQGHPGAMLQIGCWMISGVIEIDDAILEETYPVSADEGAALLEQAAVLMNSHWSMHILALYYKYMKENLEETLNWLKKSYFLGHQDALDEMIDIFELGYIAKSTNKPVFLPYTDQAAVTLESIAIIEGSASIAYLLGKTYLHKLSKVDDALSWYQRAAEFGNSVALKDLQRFAQNGLETKDGISLLEPKDPRIHKILTDLVPVLANQGRERRATMPVLPIFQT